MMSSFLEKAISDYESLIRSCILLALFLLGVFFGLYFLVVGIMNNTFSFTEKIEAVEVDNGIPKIFTRGKILSVVDVPTQQIGVESGVKLNKGKTISITAQGLVSTGSFLPENLLPTNLQERPKNLED